MSFHRFIAIATGVACPSLIPISLALMNVTCFTAGIVNSRNPGETPGEPVTNTGAHGMPVK